MKEYDVIISLGGNCSAAIQMRYRGLRKCAYPLDWLSMTGPRCIDYLLVGFANNFEDFCLKENLSLMADVGNQNGTARYKYLDTHTGFKFIHHFHRAIEDGGYEPVKQRLDRRVKRMLVDVKKARRILFVFSADFSYGESYARRLIDGLRGLYPSKEIDFALLEFCANLNPQEMARKWSYEDVAFGARYARPVTVYDFRHTDSVWSFLDEINLPGQIRCITGLSRVKYKIWKHLSHDLMTRGYGCCGIKF